MNQKDEILSHRYALAFLNKFEAACEPDVMEQLPAMAVQLDSIRSLLVYAQVVLVEGSTDSIERFFKEGNLSTFFMPLVVLLSQQKRLTLLSEVLRSLYAQYLERKGIVHFTIESAVELSQEELEEFLRFLKEKTDKKIRYTLKCTPALIAGVKIYSDTLAYEHSIQKHLSQISVDGFPQ